MMNDYCDYLKSDWAIKNDYPVKTPLAEMGEQEFAEYKTWVDARANHVMGEILWEAIKGLDKDGLATFIRRKFSKEYREAGYSDSRNPVLAFMIIRISDTPHKEVYLKRINQLTKGGE